MEKRARSFFPARGRARSRLALLALPAALAAACGGGGPDDGEPARCELAPGFEGACPSDMVFVPGTTCCIDRFEASLDGRGGAVSVRGELPVAGLHVPDAEDACALAGKFICPIEAWYEACSLGGSQEFPYGDDFDPYACNGSDGRGVLAETGSMADCEGGLAGLYDMSGNVSELVIERSEGETRYRFCGGMYRNEGNAMACWSSPPIFEPSEPSRVEGVGFRCCALARAADGP